MCGWILANNSKSWYDRLGDTPELYSASIAYAEFTVNGTYYPAVTSVGDTRVIDLYALWYE